jgi:transcriptional regulator with XRE-family HTH domain
MQALTGEQIRAARAILRITAQQLAEAAKVGVATVRRAEAEDGPISATAANSAAIRAALELLGVQFIAENGGGPGVRLAKPGGAHGD